MDTNNSDFLPLLTISREKAERNLLDNRNYILIDLKNIRNIVSLYHPLELAKMSVWEERRMNRLGKSDLATAAARLLPILLQSVLMSDEYEGRGMNRDVKKKDWQRLISLAQDLTRKLIRYVDNLAAWHYISGTISREDVMDYRDSLFVQYFPSEKTEDRIEIEKLFAEMSLQSSQDKVEEYFGVKAEEMISEIEKIAANSLTMIDDLVRESTEFRSKVELMTSQIMAAEPGLSESDAMDRVFRDRNIYAEKMSLEGRRDDFDLFRPEFVSSLPSSVYEKMSAGPGSFSLEEYLFEKGMWPSTVYPFLKFSGMYFSFVAKYIFAVSSRLSENFLELRGRVEASATAALESLFTPTDIDWIYDFDGHMVDVEILSVLSDVNPVSSPEYWQTQQKRKSEEYLRKPEYGHKMLIVDADDEADEVEDLGNDRFWTTAYHLVRVFSKPEMRRDFYTALFGTFVLEESDPLLEEIDDEDVLVPGTVAGPIKPEVLSESEDEDADVTSDSLYYNDLDDDEYEEDVKFADEETNEFDPMTVTKAAPDNLERIEYTKIYEDNKALIEEDEDKPVPVSDYSGVLDEDIYSRDDIDDDIYDNDEEEAEEEEERPYTSVVDEDDLAQDSSSDDEEEEDNSDQLDFLDLLDDFDNHDEDSEDWLDIDPEKDVKVPVWTKEDEKASFPEEKSEEEGLSDLNELTEDEDNETASYPVFPEEKAEEEGLSDLNELSEENDNEVSDGPAFPEEKSEEEGLREMDILEPAEDPDLREEEKEENLYDEDVVALLSEKLGRPATLEDQENLEELLDETAHKLAEGLSEEDVRDALSLIESDAIEEDAEEKRTVEAEARNEEHSEDESYDTEDEVPSDLYDGEGDEDDEEEGDEVCEMTDEAIDALYSDEVLSKLGEYLEKEPELEDKKWLYNLMDDSLKAEDLTEEDYNEIALAALDILMDSGYECGCGDPECTGHHDEEHECHCHDNEDGEEHECCCHHHDDESDDEDFDEDEEEEEGDEVCEMTDEAIDALYSDEVLEKLGDLLGHEPELDDKKWLYNLMDDELKAEDLTEEDYNDIASQVIDMLVSGDHECECGDPECHCHDQDDDEEHECHCHHHDDEEAEDEDSEEEDEDEYEDDEEEDGEESFEMTDEAIECLYSDEVLAMLEDHVGHEPTLEDKRWLYESMDESLRNEDLSGEDYNEIAKTVLTILDDLEEDESEHLTDEITGYEEEPSEEEEDEDDFDDEDAIPEMTDEALECLWNPEVTDRLALHVGHEPDSDDRRWLYNQIDESLRAEDLSGEDWNDMALAALNVLEDRDSEPEDEITDEELDALYDDQVVELLEKRLGRKATVADKRELYNTLDESAHEIAKSITEDELLEALKAIENFDDEYPAENADHGMVSERRDDYHPFAVDDDHTAVESLPEEVPSVDDSEEDGNPMYFFVDDESLDEEQEVSEAETEENAEDTEEAEDESGTSFAFIDEEDETPSETLMTPSVAAEDNDAPSFFLSGDDTLEEEPHSEEPETEETPDELTPDLDFSDPKEKELEPEDFYTSSEEEPAEEESSEAADEEPVEETELSDGEAPEAGEEGTPAPVEEAEEEEEEQPEEESNVLTTEEKPVPEIVHEETFAPEEAEIKPEPDEIVLEFGDEDEPSEGLTPEEELEEVKKEVRLEEEMIAKAEEAEEKAAEEEEAPAAPEEPAPEPETAEEEKPGAEEKAAETEPKEGSDGKLTSSLAKSLFFDIPGINPDLTPSAKASETIVLEYEDDEEEEEEERETDDEDVPVRPLGAPDIDESVPAEEEEEEKVFMVTPDAELPTPEAPKSESEPLMSTEDDETIPELEEEKTITLDLENPKFSVIIREIAQALGKNAGAFAEFLENEERNVLDHFNQVIKQSWERQLSDGKDKMFSIFDYDLSVLLSKSKVYDELRLEELLNNAGAVMYSKGRDSWNALMVYINKDYTVESAELRVITRDDFSAANWKIVSNIGEELIHRRQK